MGRGRTFTTRREIEDAFPTLNPDCALPLDQFDNLDLLADYWLPKAEQVRCQVLAARVGLRQTLKFWRLDGRLVC